MGTRKARKLLFIQFYFGYSIDNIPETSKIGELVFFLDLNNFIVISTLNRKYNKLMKLL